MDYKRLTTRNDDGTWGVNYFELANEVVKWQEQHATQYLSTDLTNILGEKLADLEDKIENGTLVFKKEIPNKYYALVLHRDCYGKNSWHIHHSPIEYEKENNRVVIQVDGLLYVTTKNMLFKTKAKAEAKLRELKGEQQ